MQIQASPLDQVLALSYAGHGVPSWVLRGVYQIETSSGKNIATSSTGAQGAFQFEPATAKQYGYPLTNNVDAGTFTQQTQAAAHYLHDLFVKTGSWDAALRAYSGGGYGEAQVKQAAAKDNLPTGGLTGPGTGPVGAAIGAAQSITDIPGAIAGVWNQAVSDAKYAAVLVVVLVGAVMLFVHGLGASQQLNRPVAVPV